MVGKQSNSICAESAESVQTNHSCVTIRSLSWKTLGVKKFIVQRFKILLRTTCNWTSQAERLDLYQNMSFAARKLLYNKLEQQSQRFLSDNHNERLLIFYSRVQIERWVVSYGWGSVWSIVFEGLFGAGNFKSIGTTLQRIKIFLHTSLQKKGLLNYFGESIYCRAKKFSDFFKDEKFWDDWAWKL